MLCAALGGIAWTGAAAQTQPALHDGLIALDKTHGGALDAAAMQRLTRLTGRYGWPTVKNAGRDGMDAFGRLVERAGSNEDFQDDAEAHLSTRIGIDVDALAYAALADRIELAHGRPQQFGTALALEHGKAVTEPPVTAASANGYRDTVGLPFLETYLEKVQAALNAGHSLAEAAAVPNLSTERHPVSNPQLRSQLHEMVASEEVARSAYVVNGMKEGSAERQRIATVDAAHTARIKAIFARMGVPDAATVGRSGVADFLVLAQHADMAFQADVLAKAEPLMQRGEISRQQYALMTDRVLLAQGKKQRYGSQVEVKDGHSVPLPLEDAAHVDARRAAMGLKPLKDYLQESDAMVAPSH
jgi:hypothetical protein